MKNLRFLHIADLHGDSDPTKRAKFEQSALQIVDYCREVKVNAVVIAGDVFDRKQAYAFNTGVPAVHCFLELLSPLVDFIFIVKGNNAHDEPGSIHLLDGLEPNILAFEQPAIMAIKGQDHVNLLRLTDGSFDPKPDYIISLMPYPTKASLLKDAGIDDNNENYGQVFDNLMDVFGDIHSQYICPKILGIHANIQGSRLSSGQTLISQDIIISPNSLYRAKADYYAAGHIHLRQEIASRIWYSGSIYNCNWGETEQKSFNVVEFRPPTEQESEEIGEDYFIDISQVNLTAARPMVTIEAEFKEGHLWETPGESYPQNAEYRIKCKIHENDRKLLTNDMIESLKFSYGEDVKIDLNIIPVERDSRSENIMSCRSLMDEVQEYAAVVNEEVSESMKAKVLKIQGQEVAA